MKIGMLNEEVKARLDYLFRDFKIGLFTDKSCSLWNLTDLDLIPDNDQLAILNPKALLDRLDYEANPSLLIDKDNYQRSVYDFLKDYLHNDLKLFTKSTSNADYVILDANMADIVMKLNNAGYKTRYSSQGHQVYKGSFSNPYITFMVDDKEKLDKVYQIMLLRNQFVSIEMSYDTLSREWKVVISASIKVSYEFLKDHNNDFTEEIEQTFKDWITFCLDPLIDYIVYN